MNPIRVAQITDIHLTAGTGSELHGVDTAGSLSKAVTAVKALIPTPDLVIITGDLVEDGSKAAYMRLRELLANLDIPAYVLPGNHDNVSELHSTFVSKNLHCISAMRLRDSGFVFVNSQVEGESHGCISPQELALLEKSIIEMDGCPVLVALHHTPSAHCSAAGCQLANADEFGELLGKYPNVKGIIAGHTHNASEITVGGYVQFTTPSTFAQVRHPEIGHPSSDDEFWSTHALDGTRQGFRVLDLSADGNIESDVHWI